jgi:Phage integrase family
VHRGQVAVDPKARCVAACLAERAEGYEGDALAPLLDRVRFLLPELASVGADQGFAAERVWANAAERRIVAYIADPQPRERRPEDERGPPRRDPDPAAREAAPRAPDGEPAQGRGRVSVPGARRPRPRSALDGTSGRAQVPARGLEGQGLSSHNLRHTFASLLIVGVRLYPVAVAEQLGHTNPATTLRVYAHLFDRARHAEEARERFAEGFGHLLADGTTTA